MPLRRFIRESAFELARQDLATFLEDHQDELIVIFREEIQAVDDEIPEESAFIDIRMVPLGEVILKAALKAIVRFLRESNTESIRSIDVEEEDSQLDLKS